MEWNGVERMGGWKEMRGSGRHRVAQSPIDMSIWMDYEMCVGPCKEGGEREQGKRKKEKGRRKKEKGKGKRKKEK